MHLALVADKVIKTPTDQLHVRISMCEFYKYKASSRCTVINGKLQL